MPTQPTARRRRIVDQTFDQPMERGPVIGVPQMRELVGDDVIDHRRRRLYGFVRLAGLDYTRNKLRGWRARVGWPRGLPAGRSSENKG
jgi:hypothetical protein